MNPKLKKVLIVLGILVFLFLIYKWFTRKPCQCSETKNPSGGGGGGTSSGFLDVINPFSRPNKPVAPVNPKSSGGGSNGVTFIGSETGNIVSGSGFTISSTQTTSTTDTQ